MNKKNVEKTVSMLKIGSVLIVILGILGAVVSVYSCDNDYNVYQTNISGLGVALGALIFVLSVFFAYTLQYFAADLETKADEE